MTTTTRTTDARTGLRSVAEVLLARRGAVYLPARDGSGPVSPDVLAGVTLLEADLLDRGYVLSAPLREALTVGGPTAMTAAGRTLLADIDRALGADREHTPLFRKFPGSTPHDTTVFYVERVLALLTQHPRQPCVLCEGEGTVHAVSPCAHLVCRRCFDGSDFAACPICHRALSADDPFLLPAPPRAGAGRHGALPERLRVLALGGDMADRQHAAREETGRLLGRTAALSPQDADDLEALLEVCGRAGLDWLPAALPGRETKARVLAWLLRAPGTRAAVLPEVAARLDTATDILRLLIVWSGGDPGLVEVPRLAPVPRPVRRALLGALDALDPALAVADMRRHRALWVPAAHALHPFEYADRFPRAALAVAALRNTRLSHDRFGDTLRTAAEPLTTVDTGGDRPRVRTWGGRVETALAEGDHRRATALLTQRPGELLRRLDHLLRLAGEDTGPVLSALPAAATRVSPAVLLSALGALRSRRQPSGERVFFPKGPQAKAYLADDEREIPAGHAVEAAITTLTEEVLRRAAALGPLDVAVVDADLDGIVAPFAERTASRALVTLPRGSERPLTPGRTLRLFLHWMESEESGDTDLDLSLALFNGAWEHIGTCDYTRLRHTGAVHSGDRTSAPAPDGASEFLDLDLDELERAGVRYAVAAVFSYNDVPFDELPEAFAGFMVRDEPGDKGPVFDPRTVEQRFDLTSAAKSSVPLVLDIPGRTMRWLDVVQGVSGTHHAVHRHVELLAVLGRSLTGLFTSGARVELGELAVWQAAARATTVLLRHSDGSVTPYRRRADEDALAFAGRIGAPEHDPSAGDIGQDPARIGAAFLVRGDVPLPAGCPVYALHPAGLDAAVVRLLTASDVVNSLAHGGPTAD
ncbi:MXAN_6230/SCO0854 family RING domain-containing protein [Streptomyces cucumeris]|uniref:MXAN_6230/SCO0854 family RING domain-containing protein n=1 Tax=Streptomyces cucumeris TaxID=2962890 RepID=UPI003D751BF2